MRALPWIALAALATAVFVNFDFLSVSSTMADNADVLFSEDIARGLNAGDRLFDWRLSQVPYLFPDIALARLIAYAGAAVGDVAAWYSVIYGLLVLSLVFALARLAGADPWPVCSAVGLLYLVGYFGVDLGDHIAVHFGLIGEHCGALVPIILATSFFWVSLHGDGTRSRLAAAGFFATLLAGIISDSLVTLMLLPPLVGYLSWLFFRGMAPRERLLLLAGAVVLAVVGGRLFSYANPFPTDREFLRVILARIPGYSVPSVKSFAADLAYYTTHSYLSAAILLLTISSWLCCLQYCWSGRHGLPLLLSLIVVYAVPAVIFSQLLFGLYDGVGTVRQWAPVTFLALISGAIVATAQWPVGSRHLSTATVMLTAAITGHFVLEMRGRATAWPRLFTPLADCMESSGLPDGWVYVADYWLSRPIRMFSGGKFAAVPVSGTEVFTNQANVKAIRRARPAYFVTGYSIEPVDLIREFGTPRATLCNLKLPHGQQVSVMDYSDNKAFKEKFRAASEAAY